MDNNYYRNNMKHFVYRRSIGTQTEEVQCEIGIQTGCDDMDDVNSVNVHSQCLILKNKPLIITTSFGTKFIKMTEKKDKNIPCSELTEIRCSFPDHTNTEHLQLQSLSLNIENNKSKTNIINTRSRSKLKRKYSETMLNGEEKENEENDELLGNKMNKRRRVNAPKSMNNLKQRKRVKYRKNDIIWFQYDGDTPALILNCYFEENEKFYPSKYELLWLAYTDTTDENQRKGLCSITTESHQHIKSYVTEQEMDELFEKEQIAMNGWKQIEKHRHDVYCRYFDLNHKKKPIIKKPTMNTKRRASII